MLDKLATESALLKIEALAAAAGFLNEPDEQLLHHELVALIEVVAHQAARDVFPQALGGILMNRQLFSVRSEAECALNASKAAREVLNMWLDLIPYGDDHESEALRVSVVIGQIHSAITHLEKAVAVNED